MRLRAALPGGGGGSSSTDTAAALSGGTTDGSAGAQVWLLHSHAELEPDLSLCSLQKT